MFSIYSHKLLRINFWKSTDNENQLRPELNKNEFEEMSGFDFGWYILEPIDIENEPAKIFKLTNQFSPIQKTLYFFWFLDAQVTNGGFVQFYWNGYGIYIPAIMEGLKVTNDVELIKLLKAVEYYYFINMKTFNKYQEDKNYNGLENALPYFKDFNSIYYDLNEKSMELIEKYAKQNPEQVAILI
jgi:hypothetical protein